VEEVSKSMAAVGVSSGTLILIGVIEISSLQLLIIPPTGLLGTSLPAAYLGGAIATHFEHGQSFIASLSIECLLWITATIRFPQLSRRLIEVNVKQENIESPTMLSANR